MNQPLEPTRRLYRVIVDDNQPVPAISSYRAVRNALAALGRGAQDVLIESRPVYDPLDGPAGEWETDSQSMELIEDELMREATEVYTALTLPVAIRQLGKICLILEKNMASRHDDALSYTECTTLSTALQRVLSFFEFGQEVQ